MKKTIVIFASSFLFCAVAFAHGEEKPGPHGGYIRMPGAFHTEIVPDSDTQFKIYLLDINWQNPSVKDSQVDIKFRTKGANEVVQCQLGVDFFQCQLSKGASLKKGKLSVKAIREKVTGGEVFYNLPLIFESGGGHESHGGH